jgi:isopentenyl-diphosphate delta-isomerase
MPDEQEAKATEDRKIQHINIILTKETQYREKTTMLECVHVEPRGGAISNKDVDVSSIILGRRVAAPLFISGMTGGHPVAFQINKNIAEAASKLGIPMGVGSQRAMAENQSLSYTYNIKKYSPELVLIGNMGASRLPAYTNEQIEGILDYIKADMFAIHTNPGQESVQPEGDLDFRGVMERIKRLKPEIKQSIIVKEVGNGISKEVAASLNGAADAIDVQGAGGTTWIGVETYRSKGSYGEAFWDWGIPTALSVLECKSAFSGPVFSSGGIRSALDIIRSISIGASACGMAKPVIMSERKGGAEGVYNFMKGTMDGLKEIMAEMGFENIEQLRNAKVSFSEPLSSVLEQRGILTK